MSISLDLHIVVGGSIVSPFFCWFLLCSVLWVSSCPVKVFFISRVRVQHIHAKMCLKLKTSKYLCDDRPLQFYHCYFGKLFVRLEFGFMHICTLLNARKSQQPTIIPIQPTATPKKQKSWCSYNITAFATTSNIYGTLASPPSSRRSLGVYAKME